MDIAVLAQIFSGSLMGFRGGPEDLYRILLSRKDFRSLAGCPSDARGFLLKLKEITPELRSLGVELSVLSSGLITIESRAAAEAAQVEETKLRATFFSNGPEGVETRRGFHNSEEGFGRFLAFQRGLGAGRVHEPRGAGQIRRLPRA